MEPKVDLNKIENGDVRHSTATCALDKCNKCPGKKLYPQNYCTPCYAGIVSAAHGYDPGWIRRLGAERIRRLGLKKVTQETWFKRYEANLPDLIEGYEDLIEDVKDLEEVLDRAKAREVEAKALDAEDSKHPASGGEAMAGEIKKDEEVKFTNVGLQYVEDKNTSKIQIPKGMSLLQARQWLKKFEEEENRTVMFTHTFRGYFPFDAMLAVYRAMAQIYGFTHIANFEHATMFGKMETPPVSIVIQTSIDTKQQIPWGPLEVNGIDGKLAPGLTIENKLPCLVLQGEIKNAHRERAQQIIDLAEVILKTSSIYKGKAVEIDFQIFDKNLGFDVTRQPKFMDTNVAKSDLILPDDVQRLLSTSLWTPVEHSQACRQNKIPLRRGVLMAGKYGVGKTLAARVTARVCQDNGWTFIYLRNLFQLDQALRFAKYYEPAVIFAEDVNRISEGNRDADMDSLFNVLDGVDRKNDEVMVVFTTNDLDDIHAGMLRPGRIDTVLTIYPPDAKAAARLIKFYGRDLLSADADLAKVARMLDGQIPAIIREVVERAKLAAISDIGISGRLLVDGHHLETAALQMLEHAKLLEEPEEEKPDLVILGEAIGNVIARGIWDIKSDRGDPDETDSEGNRHPDGTYLKVAAKEIMDIAGRPDPDPTS